MPSPKKPPAPDPAQTAGVRQYILVSLLALVVLLLVLLEKGLGEWSLLPVALGCVSILLQVRFGPPLVLLTLIWLLLANGRGIDPFRLAGAIVRGRTFGNEAITLDLGEILLTAATLIFCLGFYRAHSIVHNLFPMDARLRRLKATGGDWKEKRSPGSVEPRELPLLVASGFVWSVLAWLFWQWLAAQRSTLGFTLSAWRSLILFWLVSMGLLLTSGLLAYLSQAGVGPTANAVYLQDQVWQQTRREQSRINRWLVWARLRWQRRKETS